MGFSPSINASIHTSIHFQNLLLPAVGFWGSAGDYGSSQVVTGPRTSSHFMAGPHRDKWSWTFIYTQFQIHPTCMFWAVEESQRTWREPRRKWANLPTQHKKTPVVSASPKWSLLNSSFDLYLLYNILFGWAYLKIKKKCFIANNILACSQNFITARY